MQPLEPADPQQMGEYRIVGRLGAGGMGQVYLARSGRGRTVALKLVQPELAREAEFRQRFRREVAAARQTGGEWTAPVLDADLEAPTPWVATGYVAGPALQEVVSDLHGPLPERSVLALANGLAYALTDIHRAGLVHRDLKPSNVLITIDGPRMIDFGIARAAEGSGGTLTRTGMVMGSPGFMSPEQCRGETLTAASDIFCLGSVLAFAATGRSPFGAGDSAMHVLMLRIIQNEADLTGVPAGLADLVTDCLAPDPGDRPSLTDLLARTAAADTWQQARAGTPAGGLAVEPWLPASLIAALGRSAVGLLDSEEPAPDGIDGSAPTVRVAAPGTPPHPPAVGATASLTTPLTVPGETAPPGGGQAGKRRRLWWIAAASVGVVLLAGGVRLLTTPTGEGGSDMSAQQGDDEEADGADTSEDSETEPADTAPGDDADDPDDESPAEQKRPGGAGQLVDDGAGSDGSSGMFQEGETAVYHSGLEITMGEVREFQPGSFASGHVAGNTAYRVTVTVVNNGDDSVDATIMLNARAGDSGRSAELVYDFESSLDYSLRGTLLPGRQLSGEFGFSVPPDAGFLDVEYSPLTFPADSAVWTFDLG